MRERATNWNMSRRRSNSPGPTLKNTIYISPSPYPLPKWGEDIGDYEEERHPGFAKAVDIIPVHRAGDNTICRLYRGVAHSLLLLVLHGVQRDTARQMGGP